MPKKMTPSLEDYLEAICNLDRDNGRVRVTDIARALGIAKSSVHIALHNLKDAGHITHEHYGQVELTDKGREAARAILHKHEVIRRFLEGVLGVEPDTAGEEACRIEHVISDDTVARMERFTKKSD